MTPEEAYRDGLINALENLKKVNDGIVASMVPILMNGELSEWNQTVPIGEHHVIPVEVFENSEDTNLQLLMGLMQEVSRTFRSIKNINAIDIADNG